VNAFSAKSPVTLLSAQSQTSHPHLSAAHVPAVQHIPKRVSQCVILILQAERVASGVLQMKERGCRWRGDQKKNIKPPRSIIYTTSYNNDTLGR
jgi:hypothetical protein